MDTLDAIIYMKKLMNNAIYITGGLNQTTLNNKQGRKQMKKTLVSILIIVIVLSFVGCSAIQTTLEVPANVRIEENILKWSSVEGAKEYLVIVDYDEYTCSSTTFNLLSANVKAGQEYDIAVKAKGDGYFKLSSAFSAPIKWIAPATASDDNGGDEDSTYIPPENLDVVDDEAIAIKLFETGLGLGVDALSAESIIGEARKASIFTEDAFDETTIGSYKVGSTRANATSENNIVSMISSYNSKIVFGSKADASYGGMFSAGFESKFSISESIDSSQKKNQFYYTINHYYTGKNYQIKNFTEAERYESKLSDSFISALEKLESGAMTAETFFHRYGTHIVMAVSYGGMIEISHSTLSSETIKTAQLASALSENLNASIAYGLGDASAGTSINLDMNNMDGYTAGDYTSHLNIKAIGGGTNLKVSSFAALSAGYAGWVESLGNEENHCITDVADGGLVPVWYYIPEEYDTAIEVLQEYFAQQASSISDTLSAKMRYEAEDLGDIKNFAGGHGTKESPYLITTAEHFKNIQNGLDKHYKLMSDISLGNEWTPIGDYCWTELSSPSKPFIGSLDGNGKTVTYGITKNSFDNSKTFAFGLFGSIMDATIENLNLKVNIVLEKTGSGTSSTCCYAGGVTGWAKNSIIKNCTVEGNIRQKESGDEGYGVIRTGGIAGKARNSYFRGNVNKASLHSEGFNAFTGGIVGGYDKYADGSGGNSNSGSISATHGAWLYGHSASDNMGVLFSVHGGDDHGLRCHKTENNND